MKTYDVTITETLKRTVTVKADSLSQAEQMVTDGWKNSEYILNADDFVNVDFRGQAQKRTRDSER